LRKQELRQSVADCLERGLVAAAKWSAQLLAGAPSNSADDAQPAAAPAAPQPSAPETDAFQLARACFELKVTIWLDSLDKAT
jgi:hypothetical protein